MSRTQSAIVTGATGFTGSVLVDRLLKAGTRVTCLVRSRKTLSPHLAAKDLQVIETPSFDPSELRSKLVGLPVDIVFHLASYGVRQEEGDPQQLVDGNVRLVLHLLETVRDRLFAGSSTLDPGPSMGFRSPMGL
jgi:nucleoside-diphosphate-sugar epimerase